MARVAIALGSNLGDRADTLQRAVQALSVVVTNIRASSFHETDPVGVGDQPQFLNGAAVGATALLPRALLERLLAIEADFGRTRPRPGAARTLDIDLILYDDLVIEEPGLIVPHPRFREREFVLAPLSEIAGEWVDPVTGLTVAALRQRLAGRT